MHLRLFEQWDGKQIISINYLCDEALARWMERPFEEAEIKEAVFYCKRDKAPRTDGFSMTVFQDCWEVMKGDLMRVFAEFHERGIVNLSTNASFICLIPKKSFQLR